LDGNSTIMESMIYIESKDKGMCWKDSPSLSKLKLFYFESRDKTIETFQKFHGIKVLLKTPKHLKPKT